MNCDGLRRLGLAVALGPLLVCPVIAQAVTTLDFMPKGGKTLLIDVLGKPNSGSMASEVTNAKRNEEEWMTQLKSKELQLSANEVKTLAAYLAVHAPVAAATARDLPADGRELAWNGCQSCHSLFTGYLTQRRDLAGWQNMFLSPFHKELRMAAEEREEFSRYSAINMPMKFEDVPEELRF
jgi:hypothetical protein